jgi:hypothetical protein
MDDARLSELVEQCRKNIDDYIDNNEPEPKPISITPEELLEVMDYQASKGQEKLREKFNECYAALEFYADPETYLAVGFLPDPPCGPFMDDFDETEFGQKPGALARKVLYENTNEVAEAANTENNRG